MNAADELDAQVNRLAVMMLVVGGPRALVPVQWESRFQRMAKELEYAIRHTSGADMAALVAYLGSDAGRALVRRVTGLVDHSGNLVGRIAKELAGAVRAMYDQRLVDHVGRRLGTAAASVTAALDNGSKSASSLMGELRKNPAEAGPKLLVLVLSSVAASGGVDGNGGLSDLDIPLMGLGEHRSPLTHSIIIGTALEAALLLLMRLVVCTHRNLPADHDPLWNGIASQSVGILQASGQGASIGIAYHLMVDAVVQPGAYHGIPVEMPIEAHQIIMGMNGVAEGAAARAYPGEEAINSSPENLAAHKRFRATRLHIADVLREFLDADEMAILTKYGAWLQALAKGAIEPSTFAQKQFVEVARRRSPPTTQHEKAWLALVEAKRRSGLTTRH